MNNEKLLKSLVLRHDFFNMGSDFNKCSSCTYKCCSSPISVDVTFADLLCLSKVLSKKPSEIYNEYCRIALNRNPDIVNQYKASKYEVKLTLELKAPCPFHVKSQCAVYSHNTPQGQIGRPIACSVFPELLSLHKTFPVDPQTYSDFEGTIKYYSRTYACAEDNKVSMDRGQILLLIRSIINQEMILTEAMVFGESPSFIDVSPIAASMQKEFDIFFKHEDVLSQEKVDINTQVTDKIREFIRDEHPNIISRLNRFLFLLDTQAEPFAEFLQKILDNPTILPSPCKEEVLLSHNLPL